MRPCPLCGVEMGEAHGSSHTCYPRCPTCGGDATPGKIHACWGAMHRDEYKLLSTMLFDTTSALEAELNRLATEGWKVLAFERAAYPMQPFDLPGLHSQGGGIGIDPIFVLKRSVAE